MSSISLKNINKTYNKNAPAAVENLSIEIAESEFLCLLGPSGCGKTTTLRMIAGLEHPTGGQILADGKPLASVADGVYVPPEKRGMGLVFQNYALWPHLTVEQNVEFGLKLKKVGAAERERIIAEVTAKLGIAKYRKRLPSQLSGGQQQRVALARMLALKPSIILLDEPLSNLDAKLRLEMRAELKRIHQEMGSTIVFVTHDQWEAMTLATTIAVMSEGELQQLGSPDDIYERPANRFVAEFVGNLPINIIELTVQNDPLVDWIMLGIKQHGFTELPIASVGVRPESIHFAAAEALPDAARSTAGEATVVDVVPTGGSWIVELSAKGKKFFAIAGSNPHARAGDTVFFWVEQTHMHLFDAQGNRISTATK